MIKTLVIFGLTLQVAQLANAQDWPQWRGPSRDGVISADNAPRAWPATLRKAWRTEVGEGYSCPILSKGRIFIQSRMDPEEFVSALDIKTGAIIWQKKYAAPFSKNPAATKMAKGPYSTPLVDGQRLFTLGATGLLVAWNVETGAMLWKKDYSATVDTSKLFCGSTASPMMEGDSLVIQVGSDIHKGRVLALDPATGEERWSWKGPGPGYASPIAFTHGNARHIVAMTESSIVGIESKTGAELWTIPFPDEWQENIVTPLWTGSHLIVSGVRQGTHAFGLKHDGTTWKATEAWKNMETNMYMSSPVLADGVLYGLSSKKRGHFFALDAATGKAHWTTEGREGDNASVMVTPTQLIFLTNDGKLTVAARSSAKFDVVRQYELGVGQTWAAPVVTASGIVVRDGSGVSLMATK